MKDAFALAEQSPRYDELMALTPEASVLDYLVLLVLVAMGTAGAAALGFHHFSNDPMTQLLLVAAVLLVGLSSLGFTFSRMRRYQAAPIERQVALIRDETVETTVEKTVHSAQNGRSRRVSTRVTNEYYLLLELEDGERQSHEVSEELAREVVTGDLGVAYLKAGVLLDFKPLKLPT